MDTKCKHFGWRFQINLPLFRCGYDLVLTAFFGLLVWRWKVDGGRDLHVVHTCRGRDKA